MRGNGGFLQTSANVVDVEIAGAGAEIDPPAPEPVGVEADAALLDPGTAATSVRARQDRIDIASLEERGTAGEAWLVFHEAKLAANSALRSTTKPAIVGQVERYRATLTQEAERLAASYLALCRDLVRLDVLREQVWTERSLSLADLPQRDPLVGEVASGARKLRVDTDPRVILFGFDADQRNGALAQITEDLRGKHQMQVYVVGRPGARVTGAFRRPRDLPLDSA